MIELFAIALGIGMLGVWYAWYRFAIRKIGSRTIAIGGGFLIAVLASIPLMITLDSIFGVPSKNESAPQEIVYNSSWDASVKQVDKWLRDNLNDPKSLEIVEWSKVVKTEDGSGYLVRCKYRAKNSFGAMVLENKIFALDKDGVVTYSEDWTGN